MYETLRIVKQIQPKYILWENVKNILSKKHKHNFESYITIMKSLGYNSYYQILNAKNYGIPQNRERIYTISIREDIDNKKFEFPKKEPLFLKLKDMLENEVDEKYFLSENQMKNFYKNNNGNCNQSDNVINGQVYSSNVASTITTNKGERLKINVSRICGIFDTKNQKHQAGSIYDKEGLSPVIDSMQGGYRQPMIFVKNATKKGYDEAIDGDSVNLQYPNSTTRRGRVGHQVSQTLMANDNMGVIENLKIRKLTPKECWRLMGFFDEDFEKVKNIPTSNTQLYKQAGNSIVVNVLEKIFRNLLMR